MKRQTAKECLVESFKELAQTKPIDKITIKEIVDNCEYSSATFYRQFQDKYDLIAWAYTHDVEEILKRDAFDAAGWMQALTDAAAYYAKHKDYLANLLLHTSGYDSFMYNMTEINYSTLVKKVLQGLPNKKLDSETEMLIRIYVIGTVGFTCEWILDKHHSSPEKLAQAYKLSLPLPLHPYLN